jgi:hypothetical protein
MKKKWKRVKQGSRRSCRKIRGEEGRKGGYIKVWDGICEKRMSR